MAKILTESAQQDRYDFERLDGCSCHLNPPCGWCTHPGNPLYQENDESCWIEEDSPSNYYFMIWREKGVPDKFAFVEKNYWDKEKYLQDYIPEGFIELLPDNEEFIFFTSSEMVFTYNKKGSFKRGKTDDAKKILTETGFTEVECPF